MSSLPSLIALMTPSPLTPWAGDVAPPPPAPSASSGTQVVAIVLLVLVVLAIVALVIWLRRKDRSGR